jgi:hypothetical protein
MKLLCLTGHKWAGCTCERCGKARDEAHEWERDGCHLKCRRCGLPGGFEHDWDGCICRRCGEERHRWHKGKCVACNKVDDNTYFINIKTPLFDPNQPPPTQF